MGGSPWSLLSVRRCGRSIAAPHMRLPRGEILLAFVGGCDVECDSAHFDSFSFLTPTYPGGSPKATRVERFKFYLSC
jgi:hypothetical protein